MSGDFFWFFNSATDQMSIQIFQVGTSLQRHNVVETVHAPSLRLKFIEFGFMFE